jgi:eukaryotic-like serine/threonine-protein kinase
MAYGEKKKKKLIKRRFGRYLLLDHLVDGGMAEICRARFLGEQADKIVAIKMIQAQSSEDETFKTMFMDEIKVAFGMDHPNIAHTTDYGVEEGRIYTAMEYVDGKNLKQYMDRLRSKNFVFPVEISTYIVSQVCMGLHYAHISTDKLSGKLNKIIHRDISPHNIMVTYDGVVKIIDFGIAKAETNSDATQAGTIKGKLSYLAPEYLEGNDLDARYDQFAVGITLWEMLCNRKLFQADHDLAVLKLIQKCDIVPPSTINPNVPQELDEIVLRALSRDRNNRFQDMDRLNRVLVKFLYSNYSGFNPSDLSCFAQELFKDDIKRDRQLFFDFGKIDIKPFLDEMKKPQSDAPSKSSEEEEEEEEREGAGAANNIRRGRMLDMDETGSSNKSSAIKAASERILDDGDDIGASREMESDAFADRTRQNVINNATSVSRVVALNSNKGGGGARKSRRKKSGSESKISVAAVAPNKAKRLIAVSIATILILFGFDYMSPAEDKNEANDPAARQPSSVNGNASKKVRKSRISGDGKIILSNYDRFNQNIFIDGVRVEITGLGTAQLPMRDEEYILRVERKGVQHFVTSFMLNPDNPIARISIQTTPEVKYGYLITNSDCAMGHIHFTLFGEKRVEPVPIIPSDGIALPVGYEGDEIVPKLYNMHFVVEWENFPREIAIPIKGEDLMTDLCDYLDM